MIVYQQLENHFLQPVIYGRTVQLSPLAVLVSVLVGAELAGVLGAFAAIPVAGSIQVLIRDLLAQRKLARARAWARRAGSRRLTRRPPGRPNTTCKPGLGGLRKSLGRLLN